MGSQNGEFAKGVRRQGIKRPFGNRKLSASANLIFPTMGGGSLILRKPLAMGGLRKAPRIPRFWRSLARPLAGAQPVGQSRLNDWLLVLTAKRIPHVFLHGGPQPRLYVPPLSEMAAIHEILAFEAERQTPVFVPPARDNIAGVVAFLFLLVLWHGLRWRWFTFTLPDPPFPALPGGWSAVFGLDVFRFRVLHEYWRAVTALTLHADDAHLFSNIAFGLLFFIPLCRRAGLGLGIVLAVTGGILGNAANALTREPGVISIGFSTALFAAIGALSALTGADIFRHLRRFAHMASSGSNTVFTLGRRLLLPLAAGMALLGMLGGGGEARTDYAAHIWGFVCGVVTGLAALPLEQRLFSLNRASQSGAQAWLMAASLIIFVLAWLYAA